MCIFIIPFVDICTILSRNPVVHRFRMSYLEIKSLVIVIRLFALFLILSSEFNTFVGGGGEIMDQNIHEL